jgi:hypothetical protein
MTITYIPSHIGISRDLIPLLARALSTQRRLDRTNGITWTAEQVEALETLQQYGTVIQDAESLQRNTSVPQDGSAEPHLPIRGADMEPLSVNEYAERIGKSDGYVRRLCRNNKLPAEKIASEWKIEVPA